MATTTATATATELILRYVPPAASLSADAPGHSIVSSHRQQQQQQQHPHSHPHEPEEAPNADGPICWKCRGSGLRRPPPRRKSSPSKPRPRPQGDQQNQQQQQRSAVAAAATTATTPRKGGQQPQQHQSSRRPHETKDDNDSDDDVNNVNNRSSSGAAESNSSHSDSNCSYCRVCGGAGRLPARRGRGRSTKKNNNNGNKKGGTITRGRRRGWGFQAAPPPCDPPPSTSSTATTASNQRQSPTPPPLPLPEPAGYRAPVFGALARRATEDRVDVEITPELMITNVQQPHHHCDVLPSWLPGVADDDENEDDDEAEEEQLCNLTGHWRILQKRRSHRWTTDDLVTAAVAAQELLRMHEHEGDRTTATTTTTTTQSANDDDDDDDDDDNSNAAAAAAAATAAARRGRYYSYYCDLGTGNASVLQMVLHQAAWHRIPIQRALGLEARSEAVALARRSLAFNVGSSDGMGSGDDDDGDGDGDDDNSKTTIKNVSIVHADFRTYAETSRREERFDLITGTPPYFRVDFSVTSSSNGNGNNSTVTVERATIRQGGMPTSVQSAPARCEFRGGFEAYCAAAARLLTAEGTFVVCENFQNHARALAAVEAHHFHLRRCVRVEGRAGKGPLFAVYVLQRRTKKAMEETFSHKPEVVELAVRDNHSEWTPEYKRQILDFMAIPSS